MLGSRREEIRPDWIWASEDRHDPQRVSLQKRFDVDGPVQRADLRLATDFADCELRLGDRLVMQLDDYGPWIDLDVTEHVRRGQDRIELRCSGSSGPSAVVFELVITHG